MKAYVYPADTYGCGHYRLIWPAQALRAQGHDVEVVMPRQRGNSLHAEVDDAGNVTRAHWPADADVIVLQRITHRQLIQAVKLMTQEIAVVIDMDDDLAAIDPNNPAWKAMHPTHGHSPLHSWLNTQAACDVATTVTVSTDALLPRYARHGRGVVLRNRVPERYLKIEHTDSGVIGWGGALHVHPSDVQVMGPTIATLTASGEQFRVVGPRDGVARALGCSEDAVESTGLRDLQVEWPEALATLGVGVAPLADTRFNRSKCIDIQTRMTTRRGIIRLADIVEGDEVWHAREWHKIIAIQREVASPGCEIETARGHRVRVTPEHRLRVNGEWREARHLIIGNKLDMEPESWSECDYQWLPWPTDSRRTRATEKYDTRAFWHQTRGPQVTVDETWGRLLGMFLGDGCGSKHGGVGFAFDARDTDLIEMIANDLRSIGLEPTITVDKRFDGEKYAEKTITGGGVSMHVSSASLSRFLELVGVIRPKATNEKQYDKVLDVPEVIWRSPRSVAEAFLAGLFEADGSGVSGVSLTTKAETLARSVQRMLTGLGIISHVRRHESTLSYVRKNGSQQYVSWSVNILAREADKFVSTIGMLSVRKQQRLLESRVRRSAPGSHGHGVIETWNDSIVAVRDVFIESMDVQVDGSVLSVAGIVSHNSWLKVLEYSALGVPWIASPRDEYRRAHAESGAGLLAERPKHWLRAARELLSSEARRRELSEAGRAWAAQNTVEAHAWRWAEAWEHAVQNR